MPLTQEIFETLLRWLDANRETAAHKYQVIHAGLIRIFVSKGFSDAENLADETVNRVAARVPDIAREYVGEPTNYFRGVARKIALEAGRRKEFATDTFPERPVKVTDPGEEYECLLKCLKDLPPEKRELVLDYHVYEGRDKIINHRAMSEELGITESALRVQAHRVRVRLEKCMLECVENLNRKRIPS